WVVGQLEDDFPFARAKSWYESTLGGTPLSIAPQGSVPKAENENYLLPVTGQVVETFHKNGEGIMISPPKKSVVTALDEGDRKSTRLNSSHVSISYAVFCLKK